MALPARAGAAALDEFLCSRPDYRFGACGVGRRLLLDERYSSVRAGVISFCNGLLISSQSQRVPDYQSVAKSSNNDQGGNFPQ